MNNYPQGAKNAKKKNNTAKQQPSESEQPSHTSKLLAALQQAQNKQGSSSTSTSTDSQNKSQNSSQGTVQSVFSMMQTTTDKLTDNAGTSKKKSNRRKQVSSVASRMQQSSNENEQSISLSALFSSTVTNQQTPQPQQPQSQKKRPRNVSQSQQSSNSKNDAPFRGPRIPTDVLEDLDFRFISNIPDSEKTNMIRICFQVELAHWYYIDFYVENNEERKDCFGISIRDFTRQLFLHCKEFRRYANNVDGVIADWREYKSSVPTYGAILLDETLTKVLLVQGYFTKGNNWGFPKGKVNENEEPRDCAAREVREETGFDFATHSTKEKKIQKFINDTMVRLYVVPSVPYDYPFKPETRKEIKKIQWFNIDDLPSDRNDQPAPHLHGYKFFMVIPFVNEVKRIAENERKKRSKGQYQPVSTDYLEHSMFDSVRYDEEAAKAWPEEPSTSSLSLLKELFPSFVPENSQKDTSLHTPSPLNKAVTRQKLRKEEVIERPMFPLPEITPNVAGVDTIGMGLGLCTPIKPGQNPFPSFPQNAGGGHFGGQIGPIPGDTPLTRRIGQINEDGPGPSSSANLFGATKFETVDQSFARPVKLVSPRSTNEKSYDMAQPSSSDFSMPTLLQTPVVISQSNRGFPNYKKTPPQGAVASPVATSTPPDSARLPLQPQATRARPDELTSAEAPKRSSRISLSDNSAFTAIKSTPSAAKATASPVIASSEATTSKTVASPATSHRSSTWSLAGSIHARSHKSTDTTGTVHSRKLTPLMMPHPHQFSSPSSVDFKIDINSLTASLADLAMIEHDATRDAAMTPLATPATVEVAIAPVLLPCKAWQEPVRLNLEDLFGPREKWDPHYARG